MEVSLLPAIILLVSMTTAESLKRCRTLGDCACSQQCVRAGSEKKCSSSDTWCVCKEGCGVFDEFIARGPTGREVYGNMCRCPSSVDLTSTGLLPMCTRAAWFPQPDGIPESEPHPGCIRSDSSESSQSGSSEEEPAAGAWYQQQQSQ